MNITNALACLERLDSKLSSLERHALQNSGTQYVNNSVHLGMHRQWGQNGETIGIKDPKVEMLDPKQNFAGMSEFRRATASEELADIIFNEVVSWEHSPWMTPGYDDHSVYFREIGRLKTKIQNYEKKHLIRNYRTVIMEVEEKLENIHHNQHRISHIVDELVEIFK